MIARSSAALSSINLCPFSFGRSVCVLIIYGNQLDRGQRANICWSNCSAAGIAIPVRQFFLRARHLRDRDALHCFELRPFVWRIPLGRVHVFQYSVWISLVWGWRKQFVDPIARYHWWWTWFSEVGSRSVILRGPDRQVNIRDGTQLQSVGVLVGIFQKKSII